MREKCFLLTLLGGFLHSLRTRLSETSSVWDSGAHLGQRPGSFSELLSLRPRNKRFRYVEI
jgi:hypothetical protein